MPSKRESAIEPALVWDLISELCAEDIQREEAGIAKRLVAFHLAILGQLSALYEQPVLVPQSLHV